MKVVCLACNEHYADLDSNMPFSEKLVWSDALVNWHAPLCAATAEQHAAGLVVLAAMQAAAEAAPPGQT